MASVPGKAVIGRFESKGDDFLQLIGGAQENLGGIDSTGTGYGALAPGTDTEPGGVNGEVQYNDEGSFGGASGLITNGIDLYIKGRPWFDVRAYGAVGDVQSISDAVSTVSGNTVTSASNPFKAGDAGKVCWLVLSSNNQSGVTGALYTTIASVTSSSTVVLTGTINFGESSCVFYWGTDDTTAFQAAITAVNAAPQPSTVLFVPAGAYLVSSLLAVEGCEIIGQSSSASFIVVSPAISYPGNGTAAFLTVQGQSGQHWINGTTIGMRNISFDGGRISLPGLNNNHLIDASFDHFENVQILNWGAPSGNIALYATGDSQNFTNLFISNFEDYSSNTVAIACQLQSNRTELSGCFFSGQVVWAYGDLHAHACHFTTAYNVSAIIDLSGSSTGNQPAGDAGTWTLTGCHIQSSGAAVQLQGTASILRITDCFVEGTTGFVVGLGCKVFSRGCDINGYTTYAVNNAGAFYDLGGNNIIAGTFTGAGDYYGNTFTSVVGAAVTGNSVPVTSPVSASPGPGNPNAVVGYVQISIAGTIVWVPFMQ